MRIQEQVALAGCCRFAVGGPADFFVEARSLRALLEALRFGQERGLRVFLFGGGTNLFFSDQGFRGLVIQFCGGAWEFEPGRAMVRVEAGVSLAELVRALARSGLGGLEFLGNIPGTVGGAVVGNAGCYGRSLSEVLLEATLLDRERLALLESVDPVFFEFAYRDSRLRREPRWVVVEAHLGVEARGEREILAAVEAERAAREAKHPWNEPCAGSFFKNPPGFPAWKAITEAGLGGAGVGDARISPRHANFLVNQGHATSADILALVRLVRGRVRERLGIELVPEVRFVGPEGLEEMA